MPYSTIVLTGGISALAPRNVIGKALREPGSPLNFPQGMQNPVPHDSDATDDDAALACLDFLAGKLPTPDSLDENETSLVSAEFSLLHALRVRGDLSPGAVLHLIHTPTFGGRLAVELQRPFLEKNLNTQPHFHELSVPFEPALPGGLALASGAFIGLVSQLLKDQDRHTTTFAPIGGYKVMVALGHTAASFHGFESLYLHEDSQVLQRLAPAPTALGPDLRARLAPVAHRVGNVAGWSDLSPEDRALIENHPAFFTRVDDMVKLNELGQFLRLDALDVRLSPTAETTLRSRRAILEGQLRKLRDLAAADPDHPGINHDLRTAPGRAHTWRLAQMGKGIRIAWRITPDTLLVRQIWTDHAAYEREVPQLIDEPFDPKQSAAWPAAEL